VKCEGSQSNRSAIGTRLTVRDGTAQQMREVKAGSSYGSHCDTRVHFGLNAESEIPQLEVRWPSGKTQTLSNLKARQLLQLKEPPYIDSKTTAQ
jgi:enediyne biosynthesis protein E4